MHKFCFINGQLEDISNASIGLKDLGLLRGYGIFDFLPVKNNTPIFVQDYLDRFTRSAAQMSLTIEYSNTELLDMLFELIHSNQMERGYIRLLLTGGYSDNGFHPNNPSNLMILPVAHSSYPDEYYTRGIKLLSSEYIREFPRIKSINYVKVLLEQNRLNKAGAQDVLFTLNGIISESSRANFFIVNANGQLQTSETGVLEGITRKKILEIAPSHLPVLIQDITSADLANASEAFVTSTTKGAMPVYQIDEQIFANHNISDLLQSEFSTLVETYKVASKTLS